MRVSGLVHIHSTYSYDGRISLDEIAEICRTHGHSFVILTEHAEGMNQGSMRRLVSECNEKSRDDLIIIPGLEVVCDGNLHILAFGVDEYLNITDPEKLVEQVHHLDGLAVLAHPSRKTSAKRVAELELDALEIWNARHDGRLAPRVASIKLLRSIGDGYLPGCCGLDLHDKKKFVNLHIRMDVKELSRENILRNIKLGKFKISNNIISVNPKEDPNIMGKSFYYAINSFNYSLKLLRICCKKIEKFLMKT